MFKSSLTENDSFLTHSSTINEICRPLKKIGITYVSYLKNYDDGSQINLSNSADWIKHYYNFKLYQSSLYENKPSDYSNGFFLWPKDSALDVFKHGRNYFDSDNGITVVEKLKQGCEFFFFSGGRKNHWLPNVLINNFDLLESFIKYFKNNLKQIMDEVEKSRILLPDYLHRTASPENEVFRLHQNEVFELQSLLSDKANNHSNAKPFRQYVALLTSRENDIAYCLINGKTAKETAKELSLSPRTVERHLEHIKRKLNCRTKFELATKILNEA